MPLPAPKTQLTLGLLGLFLAALGWSGREPFWLLVWQTWVSLGCVWCWRAGWRPRRVYLGWTAALAVVVLSSLLGSVYAAGGLIAAWKLLLAVLTLGMLVPLLAESHRRLWVLRGLTLVGAAVVGAALFGWWRRGDTDAWLVGWFGWHNQFAGWLGMLLPVAVAGMWLEQTSRWRLIQSVAAAVLGVGLAMTDSRAGIGLGLVALTLVSLVGVVRIRRSGSVLLGAGLISLVVGVMLLKGVLPTDTTATQRQVTAGTQSLSSWQTRWDYWQNAWEIGFEQPWTGAGLGQFANAYAVRQTDVRYYATHAHNMPLEFWAETGVPGLLWMGLSIVLALWLAWKGGCKLWSDRTNVQAWLVGLGAGGGLLVGLGHALVDIDWIVPSLVMVFVVLGSLWIAEFSPGWLLVKRPTTEARPTGLIGGLVILGLVASGGVIGGWMQLRVAHQLRLAHYEEAIDTAEAAKSWLPWSARLRYQQAQAWLRLSEFSKAAEVCRQVFQLHPTEARYALDCGLIEQRSGEAEQALTYFREAIALGGKAYPQAYLALSSLYDAQAEYGLARLTLEQAAEVFSLEAMRYNFAARDLILPEVRRVYLALADSYQVMGDDVSSGYWVSQAEALTELVD